MSTNALNSRIVIEQAKVSMAQMRSCTVDEAFLLLRAYCRDNHLRLSVIAHRVVTEPAPIPGLTTV